MQGHTPKEQMHGRLVGFSFLAYMYTHMQEVMNEREKRALTRTSVYVGCWMPSI